MTTWVEDIEHLAGGEAIEAVRFGIGLYGDDGPDRDGPGHVAGRLMDWPEAREALIRGEAGEDYWKWPILAWTASWIIFTHDYDTMRDFLRLPRNPGGEWSGYCVGDDG